MKLFSVVFATVGLALTVAAEPININYHEDFGIPAATRIKYAEQARDFDGSRVLGGQISNLGQNPHFGGLIILLDDFRQSVCGSSLLSNTRLVTAAHCWRTAISQAIELTVVLASVNLFSGGVRIVTSDVELHAAYNSVNLNNDIAIIRISHVPYSHVVQRILLPTGDSDYAGTWGTTVGIGSSSNADIGVQQHAQLQVIRNEECAALYGPSVVTSSKLCTATTGGRGICGGDVGGPLSIGDVPSAQLIGIVSFYSQSGCDSALPAGFTRVTSYLSWIQARL
ncbi:collagenase-like [Melitaea cinxia]|uniref:collagenase-like n=1 Tax=Melitaea cinxia TaxID=113334 RepID=UPI001E26ECDA|nr:collagenase-like [Melitaea cinxia]